MTVIVIDPSVRRERKNWVSMVLSCRLRALLVSPLLSGISAEGGTGE